MISYKQASDLVLREGRRNQLPEETIAVGGVSGRVCAEAIFAPAANQPFDNSAMDGYALRAGDLAAAANGNPVMLEMADHIAAGDGRSFKAPQHGQCYEIMTGAPLPPGCDAVVPVEKTVKDGVRIKFSARVEQGENIRRAGEDFRAGDAVVEKGCVFDAGHILALATLGIGTVKVFRKPSVALISTGQEIVDDMAAVLKPGQIYNSTKPYLEAALAATGAGVCALGTVKDDPESFKNKIHEMMERNVDIGISTGAVSAGVHDFVPAALKEMGAEIFFHKVAIRPGKPLIFARLPGGTLFFGLPGNPVASAVGLRFFIQPAIRALQALPPEEPQYAVLKSPFRKNHNLTQFLRAKISCGADAVLYADIPPKQQSFMVRPFTDTNGWAVIPEGDENIAVGEKIEIYQ